MQLSLTAGFKESIIAQTPATDTTGADQLCLPRTFHPLSFGRLEQARWTLAQPVMCHNMPHEAVRNSCIDVQVHTNPQGRDITINISKLVTYPLCHSIIAIQAPRLSAESTCTACTATPTCTAEPTCIGQTTCTGTPTCLHLFLNRQAFCRYAAMTPCNLNLMYHPMYHRQQKTNAFLYRESALFNIRKSL